MRRRNLVSGGKTFQAKGMAETERVGKKFGKFQERDSAMKLENSREACHTTPKNFKFNFLYFSLPLPICLYSLGFLKLHFIDLHSTSTPLLPSWQMVG